MRIYNNSLVWLCFLVLSLITLTSCSNNHSSSKMAEADTYYTCSMDPQVVENHDGICPICHMKLIEVKKNQLKPGQLRLSQQQISLANITLDTLRPSQLAKEIVLNGKVTVDQNLLEAVSAKVGGRIEKLTVKNVGDYIVKGQLLYEIYSEDLCTTQREFLVAKKKGTSSQVDKTVSNEVAQAAKEKLKLYGMADAQIENLAKTGNVVNSVPIYAASDGYVLELSTGEGKYVSSGATLFRLASLASLWVEAQVYLPYLPFLKLGTEAKFAIPASGDITYHGQVVFIDPQVQSPQRYVLARFHINGVSAAVKPGMLAQITLTTSKVKALTVPLDAVNQDSHGTTVWVRNKDGVFEIRMVSVGAENSTQVEITDGLKVGDVVVVTGAYLLNSEYVFKKGANPMEGHAHMGGMDAASDSKGMGDMNGMSGVNGMNKADGTNESNVQSSNGANQSSGTPKNPKESSVGKLFQLDTTSLKRGAVYYQCPMDLEVISAKPGSCPKCNMDLEKVTKR